ncbi:MAG: UDP-N-acetylgalactosamine-undecaprenyl-phosphate N-acetylgalactosaminephosphotransferase [Candidatus Ordinivivax streblomastigis]|uniref:UDP-N-acetylgalactosamine-undecaprenyl-phosphate N-acetylgalactosaminephosphotransferase n=1 Tax=Candidatus Ordinivivax streblomastigis TaxID=2540710 RepID=A0A5M8P5D3_9BACT|nr:MAG: UDP-N-acetylgalactosamine-undecaprenyl-phosphate N-acetylgalactosaminephosphotransferase [Candidatus Ordinivivax streblomastigis]
MKRILIILIDLVIVYVSFLLAYKLLGSNLMNFWLNIWAFYTVTPIIGILYLILMYAFGLYDSVRRPLSDVIYTVFLISVFLTVCIMASCFFIRGVTFSFPRSIIFTSALFYWGLLTIWQVIVWKFYRRNFEIKVVTVIGQRAEELGAIISHKYKNTYHVKYICDEKDENLVSYMAESNIVFLSAGVTSSGRDKILLYAAQNAIGVYFVPAYRDIALMSAIMEKTDDIPTFFIDIMGLSFEERVVKRSIDLLLGILSLIVFLPFGLMIAICVKLDGGPLFYSQERLTKNGKVFKMIKFRTMIPDAEKLSGPVLAEENDPRITKVGRILRAIRLDEAPQILNILKGEMSIVGPRPERPFFISQFEKKNPDYQQRLKVKAGLTGLAQVEGKYNTAFENKLRYDLIYISNYSLFQDLLIMIRTVKILFVKESTKGVS